MEGIAMSAPTTKHLRGRKTSVPHVADDYLDLVKRFPLRPLRSADDMRQAGAILDEYVGREDLSSGQTDYIAALVRFVRDYEEQIVRNQLRRLRPSELLRYLMKENQMNTSD